jgi:hypothetical protein
MTGLTSGGIASRFDDCCRVDVSDLPGNLPVRRKMSALSSICTASDLAADNIFLLDQFIFGDAYCSFPLWSLFVMNDGKIKKLTDDAARSTDRTSKFFDAPCELEDL